MSHLLAIAVGPVQEFIAAARRTRDLWFGSYLLSEISKAVAKSVKEQGGALIFPNSDTDLTSGNDKINVANVILAELPSGEPRSVAAEAKLKAQVRWLDFVKDVEAQAASLIRLDIWDNQKNDVIEFYAAWLEQTGNYVDDRKRVMRLLAGRKNLRDFQQAKLLDQGLPKSSLDGQRATALQKRTKYPTKFRIRKGEQLDIVGLVKRVAEGNRPYPSVSRIAADPWVRSNKGKQAFEDLKKACEELPKSVLHRLDVFPQFREFPFEGTAVYVNRHSEWEEEISDEDRVSLSFLQDSLSKLKEPSPYLAVLVADGDKMGAAISEIQSASEHRKFSEALAGFADTARTIVTKHNGVLVYAGGDDVLAFVPVDHCLSCARMLRDKFVDLLKDYKNKEDESPTLSVGIAIAHFLENLEDLLEYGRAAEKSAKAVDRKDALAVHLLKRGGSPIKIASRWETAPDVRLHDFAKDFIEGILPSKLPYELRQMAELYKTWPKDSVEIAVEKDVARLIAKKQSKSVEKKPTKLDKHLINLTAESLLRLAKELLVARLLASVMKQTNPTSPVEVIA